RAAVAKSPYADLEAAVAAAGAGGLTRELVAEIGYLSGIKPLTSAKIMGDAGGGPLAILCKGTGLARRDLAALWRAMRRPETTADGDEHPDWRGVQIMYDNLSGDGAHTSLRYGDCALSSARTPAPPRAIREGEEALTDAYSAPERAALMALAENFGR